MRIMYQESNSKDHLPGVKAHLEGAEKKMRLHFGGVKSSNAFTLVEILVAIAIVAVLGIIMVVIFTNTLRGSNKAQILAVIKQNGQAVLESLDKTIRSADNVICPRIVPPAISASSNTLVIEKARSYTRFKFIVPITANGEIQQDSLLAPSPSPGSEEVFLTTVCTDPLVSPITLTDTNLQTGVSVNSGSFTRNRQPGSKDSVTVEFTLGPGVRAPSAVRGQIDPVEFQTTIQLR